ncbi:MAG TPA: shikimate kinase [Ignavibacteriales bacterium]|nr:shikimate kinase [Ignavibacteriales bacterium]
MQKSNIYLIGFMGTGKSTVGPILANSIGYDFFDLDKVIENKTTLNISEIFSKYGEDYFRKIETETLFELVENYKNVVIALGGGTIKIEENFNLIKKTGYIINIYADLDALVERLSRKKTRPLLLDENGELLPKDKLKEKIQRLLSERQPIYQKADFHVKSEPKLGVTVDKVIKIIEEKIFNGKN